MIAVHMNCSPIAWFADERHADVFADALRAAGALGVSVVPGRSSVADALDNIRAAVERLEAISTCEGTMSTTCECGEEVEVDCDEPESPDIARAMDDLEAAIERLESL